MKRFFLFTLALATIGSLASCQKQQEQGPALPFTTSFQLLNEQRQPASSFPYAQNIIFQFQIINISDKAIYFNAPLLDTQHFLEVSNSAGTSLGKPYQGIFCATVGAYVLAARDTMNFSIPWLEAAAYPIKGRFCGHAATTTLPIGHYQTTVNPSVTWHQDSTPTSAGPSSTTPNQTLSLEFEVTGAKKQ